MKQILHGISEIGVIVGNAQVPFGLVTEDGVTVEWSEEVNKIRSAQHGLAVEHIRYLTDFSASATALKADLSLMAQVFGVTVQGTTDKTVELVSTAIGAAGAKTYYIKSQGAEGGDRLIVIHRGELVTNGGLTLSKDVCTLGFKIEALANLDGTADVTITDAAA
jgi:hypothetical protein